MCNGDPPNGDAPDTTSSDPPVNITPDTNLLPSSTGNSTLPANTVPDTEPFPSLVPGPATSPVVTLTSRSKCLTPRPNG